MDPTFFALAIVILLFSVILHEVMHGLVALKFGDHTAERAGRLTLNPLPHIDLVGTILVPAILILPALFSGTTPGFIFGWAKPVPVNPFNFKDIRKGELFTSAAGVLANLGMAILAAIIFHLTTGFSTTLIQSILLYTANINLILAIFNSLPIPPLDGSKILMSFLPNKLALQFQQLEKYGFVILIMLWFIPVGNTTLLSFILSFFTGIFRLFLGI